MSVSELYHTSPILGKFGGNGAVVDRAPPAIILPAYILPNWNVFVPMS